MEENSANSRKTYCVTGITTHIVPALFLGRCHSFCIKANLIVRLHEKLELRAELADCRNNNNSKKGKRTVGIPGFQLFVKLYNFRFDLPDEVVASIDANNILGSGAWK